MFFFVHHGNHPKIAKIKKKLIHSWNFGRIDLTGLLRLRPESKKMQPENGLAAINHRFLKKDPQTSLTEPLPRRNIKDLIKNYFRQKNKFLIRNDQVMVKNMFLIVIFLLTVNVCAQNEKGVKEISIYESPLEHDNLKNSLRSKIRSVRLYEKTDYYVDLNVGNIYCTIAYENLEDLISGIQRLEKKATLDSINQEDDVKNIVMTPSGFVIGYYMNKGKVKRFFGFGQEQSNSEDINRNFSTYEEDFDTFNSERETYGTYKSRLNDFDVAIESLRAVKERIEEIKLTETEL